MEATRVTKTNLPTLKMERNGANWAAWKANGQKREKIQHSGGGAEAIRDKSSQSQPLGILFSSLLALCTGKFAPPPN